MNYRRWMKHGTTDDPAEIIHCIVGDEYSLANTYFDALGKRHCVTCRLAPTTSGVPASWPRRSNGWTSNGWTSNWSSPSTACSATSAPGRSPRARTYTSTM
jgi:hypothetical protein